MSVRFHRQKICLTHAQREWLVRRSAALGITISEFLRRVLSREMQNLETKK